MKLQSISNNQKMFLDDIRQPPSDDWMVCRSSNEAIQYVEKHGMPDFISFDHDLGGNDTAMVFLHYYIDKLWNGTDPPPQYNIHSANPIGSNNIDSFMKSWKRSITL